MSGIIGKKIGMTSIYDENGKNIPCTIIEAGPCVVTQVKTKEVDGYNSVQLAYGETSDKNISKSRLTHFRKAKTSVKRKLHEFQNFEKDYELGDQINVLTIRKDLVGLGMKASLLCHHHRTPCYHHHKSRLMKRK